MKKVILQASLCFAVFVVATIQSCTKDLDLSPTNDVTSETVYANLAGYESSDR